MTEALSPVLYHGEVLFIWNRWTRGRVRLDHWEIKIKETINIIGHQCLNCAAKYSEMLVLLYIILWTVEAHIYTVYVDSDHSLHFKTFTSASLSCTTVINLLCVETKASLCGSH